MDVWYEVQKTCHLILVAGSDILLLKKLLFNLLFTYDTIILILIYFQFTQ